MALKSRIAELTEVPTEFQSLYEPAASGSGFALKLEDVNLDGLMNKNAELLAETKAAKSKAAALEQAQQEAQKKLLEEQNQYQTLYKQAEAEKANTAAQLEALKKSIADQKKESAALALAATFTKDERRLRHLTKELMQHIETGDDGSVTMTGILAGDEKTVSARIKTEYDFLVDSVNSSGGGATGGNAGQPQGKKFAEMTERERLELKQKNPEQFYAFLRGK